MNLITILVFAAGLPVILALFAVSRAAISVLAQRSNVFAERNAKMSSRLLLRVFGILFIASAALANGCAGAVTKSQSVSPTLAASEREKQQLIAFDTLEARQKRLSNLSFPILRAASPLCGKHTRHRGGFQTASRFDYGAEWRDVAVKRHGVGDSQRIIWIDNNSPAEHAGLKYGDILISADGKDFPSGKNARDRWNKTYQDAVKDGKAALVVMRGGGLMTIHITPVKVCAYNSIVAQNDSVNAYADGENIHITTGMIRFTDTDQELALVVAHELAHNAMRHIDKQTQNRLGGAIAEGLISGLACAYGGVCGLRTGLADAAGRAFSQEFEAEADYVGLYIMARAGMEIEGAANFWRRMAAENPASIATNHTATHPSSPERFLAMEKTIEEINRKKSKGLDLMPDFKE